MLISPPSLSPPETTGSGTAALSSCLHNYFFADDDDDDEDDENGEEGYDYYNSKNHGGGGGGAEISPTSSTSAFFFFPAFWGRKYDKQEDDCGDDSSSVSSSSSSSEVAGGEEEEEKGEQDRGGGEVEAHYAESSNDGKPRKQEEEEAAAAGSKLPLLSEEVTTGGGSSTQEGECQTEAEDNVDKPQGSPFNFNPFVEEDAEEESCGYGWEQKQHGGGVAFTTSPEEPSANEVVGDEAEALNPDKSHKDDPMELARALTTGLIQAHRRHLDDDVQNCSMQVGMYACGNSGGGGLEVLKLLHEWMAVTSIEDPDAENNRRSILYAGGHYVLLHVILPAALKERDFTLQNHNPQLIVACWMSLVHLAMLPESRMVILGLGCGAGEEGNDEGEAKKKMTTLGTLVKSMERHPAHATVQVTACGLLAQLLTTVPSSASAETGTSVDGEEVEDNVDDVCEGIYTRSERENEERNSAAVARYAVSWIELGGTAAILHAMVTFPSNVRLQRYGGWAIERLSHSLLVLVAAATTTSDDDAGDGGATSSLQLFRQHEYKIATAVVDMIVALQSMVERHAGEPLVTEYADAALDNLLHLANRFDDAMSYPAAGKGKPMPPSPVVVEPDCEDEKDRGEGQCFEPFCFQDEKKVDDSFDLYNFSFTDDVALEAIALS